MSVFTLCLFAFAVNVVSGLREPEGALPELQYTYDPKGVFDEVDGLPIYVSAEGENSGSCVVWVYDIFGWVSPGRGFEMVDQLSAETGMVVVFPDFFRGGIYHADTLQWDDELQARTDKTGKHKSVILFSPRIYFSLIGMTELSHTCSV